MGRHIKNYSEIWPKYQNLEKRYEGLYTPWNKTFMHTYAIEVDLYNTKDNAKRENISICNYIWNIRRIRNKQSLTEMCFHFSGDLLQNEEWSGYTCYISAFYVYFEHTSVSCPISNFSNVKMFAYYYGISYITCITFEFF